MNAEIFIRSKENDRLKKSRHFVNKDEIDKGNHKLCFMRFDNIIKNLKLIGIKISFSDKEIINEIYKRRNQIAHQTDRNPPKTEKQDITRELVEMYINKIEELVEAIDKAIKNKDGC